MKLVLVEWVDSCGENRWHAKRDAASLAISRCWSVGAVISENDDQIVIAPNGDPAVGNVLYEMAIPRAAIKRMRNLRMR